MTPPPAELVDQVVRMGVAHADMWAISNPPAGTMAEYTRGMIATTIRHLLEVGLLVVADDAPAVLDAGPVPSRWPG